MADWGRGRARTWPEIAASLGRRGPAWGGATARFFEEAGRRIGAWSQTDVAPGRLIPWVAIAFGLGIVIYLPPIASRRGGQGWRWPASGSRRRLRAGRVPWL